MKSGLRFPLRKPPYWGNIKQEDQPMTDALSLLVDATRFLELACKEANVPKPEICFPSFADKANFEMALMHTETARMILVTDETGPIFDLVTNGIRITSPD